MIKAIMIDDETLESRNIKKLAGILFFVLMQVFIGYSQSEQKNDSLQKVLSLQLIENDTVEIFNTYYSLGNILYKANRFFEANIYYKEALKYANLEQRAKIYNKQGIIYWYKGEYCDAMNQYRKVLKICEDIGNKRFQAMALNNIGFIYAEYENQEKALEYYLKALEIRKEDKDSIGIGLSYNSIGRCYLYLDSLEKSLEYHNKSLNILKEINYAVGESNALSSISNVYSKTKQYNLAMNFQKQSLEIRKKLNHSHLIAESYKNIAKICIHKLEYKNAESNIEKGILVSNEIQSRKLLKEFNYLLYELNKQKGNYEKALADYLKYTEIKDSLTSLESENKIAELEIHYETEKKEQKIEILDQENQIKQQQLNTRKYLLVVAIILISLIIVVSILLFRQNKLKSQLNIEHNKQKLLRSQMNPHFIYNSLSAIQNFILQNDTIESVSYIAEFSSLMRLVLEGSRKDYIVLKEDIDLNNYYLRLQQLRFNNTFQYELIVDEKLNTELIKIPPMLIQPFIENAVEHGMRKIENESGLIKINYQVLESNLLISVEDNGPGFLQSNSTLKENHISLATQITKERILNIEKLQKRKIKFEVIANYNEKNEGFKVMFSIPKK